MSKITKSVKVKALVTDYELLVDIAKSSAVGDEDSARSAFRVFYDRHKGVMMKICMRACQKSVFKRDEYAQDIFQNCMKRSFEKAHVIVAYLDKFKDRPGENLSNRLHAYLASIAKNEFKRYLHKVVKMDNFLDFRDNSGLSDSEVVMVSKNIVIDGYTADYIDHIEMAEQAEAYEAEMDEIRAEQAQVFWQAFDGLKLKYQDVLHSYLSFEKADGSLPPEQLKLLCDKYDIVPGTVRTIKKRAIAKILQTAMTLTKK